MVGIPPPLTMSEPRWDWRFVLLAVLVGAGYAVIVTIVTWLAGKEVAGVAGVVLTAVALAFLRQAEIVQLRQSQAVSVEGPAGRGDNGWYLALVTCACPGLQFGVMIITAPFVIAAVAGGPARELIGRVGTTWILASWTLGCFVLGFLYAKSTNAARYFYAASAPLISTMASIALSMLLGAGWAAFRAGAHQLAAVALLFSVAAVLGTWCGLRLRWRRRPRMA
jgi:hypothetical protein